MRSLAALSVLFLVASCGGGDAASPAPDGEQAPGDSSAEDVPETGAMPVASNWTPEAATRGGRLRYRDGHSEPVDLACMDGLLEIHVRAFQPVASEERLSVGFGEEIVTMVADLSRTGDTGVHATAPLPSDLAALLTAGEMAASYGAQNFGPVEPPNRLQAESFALLCEG